MKKQGFLYFLCVVTLFLSGCIETKDEYVINPDGTGKIYHEAILQSMNLGIGDESRDFDPEKNAQKLVKEEIEKAKGIDAWRDVSWESLGENKVKFKGTAYYRDIKLVEFHNSGFLFSLLDQMDLNVQPQEISLVIKSKDSDARSEKINEEDVDEALIQSKIAQAKEKLNQTEMMLSAGLSSLKIEKIFRFPGKRLSSSNFQIHDDGRISLTLTGEKVLGILDSYMNSDEWMREDILRGRDPLKDGPESLEKINEILLGDQASVEATYYDVITPLFNYEEEVSEAKKQTDELLGTLGVMISKKIDPSLSGKFRVGGIRLIFESDYDNDIRPFNYDNGLTLSLIGQLPHKALKVKEGSILSAQTDNGQDLLPENEWDCKINFAGLGKDKVSVIFDVKLMMPNKQAQKIETLTGELVYVTANESKVVDLGISEFSPRVKGDVYNAVIESIGQNQWGGEGQQMDLKMDLSIDSVKEIRIYDESGTPVQFSKGYNSFNDVVTFNLTKNNGDFPEKGKIEVEIFEGMERYDLPFSVENISIPQR